MIKEKLAGPDFVWFFPGWFRANWWAAVDGTDCTAEEMGEALEHSLGALGNSVFDIDLSRILVSNKVLMINYMFCSVKSTTFCRMCHSSCKI